MDILRGVLRALLLVLGMHRQHVGLADGRVARVHVQFDILGAGPALVRARGSACRNRCSTLRNRNDTIRGETRTT